VVEHAGTILCASAFLIAQISAKKNMGFGDFRITGKVFALQMRF
jgi:hypothetical protein